MCLNMALDYLKYWGTLPNTLPKLFPNRLRTMTIILCILVSREGRSFYDNVVRLSTRLQRPVRCSLDRAEDMIITGSRHPFLGRYKVHIT